jgi:hypothetical protein
MLWQFCREKLPRWLMDPLLAASLWGAAAAAVIIVMGHQFPGGVEAVLAIGAYIPVAAFIVARAANHANPGIAFASVLAVVAAGHGIYTSYQANYLDKYAEDLAFVRESARVVPADSPVYLQFDWIAPLETFWMFYHNPRQASTIRDPWQLAERSAGRESAYILTRRFEIEKLEVVGKTTIVLESRYTRGEHDPAERRVLCLVIFHKNIPPPNEEYLRVCRRTLW